MDPARRVPTLADLEALPSGVKGEIIDGVLYTMTRPRGRHQHTGLLIGAALLGPFHRGAGGPGGWWILPEPGIELPNAPEISPDIAGWRRERLTLVTRRRRVDEDAGEPTATCRREFHDPGVVGPRGARGSDYRGAGPRAPCHRTSHGDDVECLGTVAA